MNIPKINMKFVSDHAPAILTAMGVAGVVTTGILTARATSRAKDILYEQEPDVFEIEVQNKAPLSFKEKFQLTWHLYLPPVLTGAVSVACIIGSHSIHVKRQAALLGLFSLTERALIEYEKKAIEVVGEGKAVEIRDRVAQGHIDDTPRSKATFIRTGQGDHLCFDRTTERYFTGNVEHIRQTIEAINEELRTKQTYVTLNDFFRRLELPPVVLGDDLGWTSQKIMHVSFTSTLDEGDWPCLALNYHAGPIRGPLLPERSTS